MYRITLTGPSSLSQRRLLDRDDSNAWVARNGSALWVFLSHRPDAVFFSLVSSLHCFFTRCPDPFRVEVFPPVTIGTTGPLSPDHRFAVFSPIRHRYCFLS